MSPLTKRRRPVIKTTKTGKTARGGRNKKRQHRWVIAAAVFMILAILALPEVISAIRGRTPVLGTGPSAAGDFTIPEYTGSICAEINGNVPFFLESDLTTETYEEYSPLDSLGRCGPAMACLGRETMPDEERGPIDMIRPSGWHTVRYDDLIEEKYLYNRCHLIAYMLTGENGNERNLITGTRYMNTAGMLPFELETANYILNTRNHVLYRVTPCFRGKDLAAYGVLMEAFSVEDNGQGLSFNVFVFNVQPGIEIDYRTGNSRRG